MKALVADATSRDPFGALRLAEIDRPEPRRGEVLVRMHAAPCNPADILYLEGRYGIDRPLPATPGFEGSGVVVASGGGLLGRWLVGKRVACGGHECSGTWAEYAVVPAMQCLPLAKALTFEQGAGALANPTTALAIASLARGHRAYVQTAAAGQLGKMICIAMRERGLEGIHVVRRAEQADVMRRLGAEHVLVSSDAAFDRDLAALSQKLGATIAFDAVAGTLTGRLVAAMPRGADVVVYGALSGEPVGAIDPMQLAFGAKRVRGFEVATHVRALGLLGGYRLARSAQRHVQQGAFTSEIADRVSLADAPARLAQYAGRMSDGKIMLVA
jgi:NADPH2:quinone reductase